MSTLRPANTRPVSLQPSPSPQSTIHTRRRPRTPSLFLLFDTVPLKSSALDTPPFEYSSPDETTTPDVHATRRFHGNSLPRPRPTPRSPPPPPPSIDVEAPSTASSHDMQFSSILPPTPTPSIPSQRASPEEKMFINAEAGPSHSLPPTPPVNDGSTYGLNSSSSLAFQEPTITQRPRRGRRPASAYPVPEESAYQPQRKSTDPTPRAHQDAQLDVDLDAYSTADFDESREPTLSFVTTSTVDSTTGTPQSIGGEFEYKPGAGKQAEMEPRIRVRTGRSTAYSSAESSGAYSYHAYADNNIYNPSPPPMPSVPSAYANDQVGLGITAHDVALPSRHRDSQIGSRPSTNGPVSPTNSFAHRPWKRDVINRLRSDSASSSITTASVSTSDSHPSVAGGSTSSHPYPFAGYAHNLPWEREEMELSTPDAVGLVDEGMERIFDRAKLEEIGGLEALTADEVAGMRGTTHLLLPDLGAELLTVLPALLSTLAPSLVVLDISENYFSFLPEALRNCTSLEELNISTNPIRALPTWLSELIGLRMLVADGCGLQNLPHELSNLNSLHTICARRNRLVSLPSWLCLLSQLETLRIDDNPFASEWQPIVAPILSYPPRSASAPSIPPRSASQRALIQSHASFASFSSSRSSAQSHDLPASGSAPQIGSDGWMSPTSSAAQSMYQLSGLGPIAEDQQPHSAPPLQHGPIAAIPLTPLDDVDDEPLPLPPPRPLRKMRSAGSLLSQTPEGASTSRSTFGSKTAPNASAPSTAALIPPSASRFASLGSAEGRRAASAMGNYDSESELSPLPTGPRQGLTVSTSTKPSKWGFLRKMSMNRLKGDKSEKSEKATLAASASANLSSLPPPLVHAVSDIGPGHGVRPSMSISRTAMTLPTRKTLESEVSEFGEPRMQTSASTLPLASPLGTLPSRGSIFSATGGLLPKRGKRRSFLPVDTPPSINIAIPSTSPFMPTTTILEDGQAPTPPPKDESGLEDTSMTVSASQHIVESPSDDLDSDARYMSGLETIKSYLRDLFDLSRPPVEPYGGFEVVSQGDGSCGGSVAASDHPASPASGIVRGSISEARRARRPTLETQLSRNTSTASVIDSEKGSFAGTTESVDGKKFKNDKSKRARVLREIYETERTYVRGLGELVTIYVKPAAAPLGTAKGGETVVPAGERKVVFGGIESILSIHRDNLLPALEKAVKPLLEGVDDEEGELSTKTAHAVGEVFRTYIAYMKQYSTYINNFDNALSRMKTWTAPSSAPGTPAFGPRHSQTATTPSVSSAAISVGVGLGAVSLPSGDPVPHSGGQMSTNQRKRVKTFLKRCREHPLHSQINLESYLLLPIQRVPRYKLLLEDLAMCTLPRNDGPRDTLDDAMNEIASLASLMNEEKRDADSRLRLYHWQQRISSRGPSPLVQPHRKLILDGPLTLIRLVKKASSFVEVESANVVDAEQTIMPSKVIVPIEHIAPEPMDRPMMLVLCSDLLVLVQQGPGSHTWDGQVDLFNVLRMATLREPASIVHGNVLRVVDNKSIYYFNGASQSETLQWCRAINTARRR